MDETQNIHDLAEKIVEELTALQFFYSDEGVTDAQAEVTTVPVFTLSPAILPKLAKADNKQKKKAPVTKVQLDNTPIEVVQTVIVLKPITGMDEKKVAVSVHLKLTF